MSSFGRPSQSRPIANPDPEPQEENPELEE
jgi:hypothetical protein